MGFLSTGSVSPATKRNSSKEALVEAGTSVRGAVENDRKHDDPCIRTIGSESPWVMKK